MLSPASAKLRTINKTIIRHFIQCDRIRLVRVLTCLVWLNALGQYL